MGLNKREMENTLGNKEKFFTVYWGQEVMVVADTSKNTLVCVDTIVETEDGDYLLLTELRNITDEDAIEVSRILSETDIIMPLDERQQLFHVNRGKSHVLPVRPCNSNVCDYLRSKGYLLPFMGLSTEELISRGWAKLKTP